MRVALVTSSYWPIVGGQMIYARDLAHELVSQGHTVTVVTRFTKRLARNTFESLAGVEEPREYKEDGVHVRVVAPRRLRRLALLPVHRLHYYPATETMAIRLFTHALTEEVDRAIGPCDVVHFNGVGRELFGFCAREVARRRGVPFILTTHMHPGTWGDSPLDFRLYRTADRILAHTNWEREVYIAGSVDAERVPVVGIGVPFATQGDGARARARYGIEGPIVLFVARKAHYKGYGLVIETAPLVWKHVPETRFVLVGPAQDTVSASQREILKDPRVVDIGAVTSQERDDFYDACTLLCVPSAAESFGLVYFEAWVYQKPVIALDIPPLRELIGECGGGILVTQPSPAEIAAATVRLLRDPLLRKQMGAAGRAKAERYHPEAIVRRVVELYVSSSDNLSQ